VSPVTERRGALSGVVDMAREGTPGWTKVARGPSSSHVVRVGDAVEGPFARILPKRLAFDSVAHAPWDKNITGTHDGYQANDVLAQGRR